MPPQHGELITCYCKDCCIELQDSECDCVMPLVEIGIKIPMAQLESLLLTDPFSEGRAIEVQEIASMYDIDTYILEQHLQWIERNDMTIEQKFNKIYSISPLETRMKYRMEAVAMKFRQQFNYRYGRADFFIHPNIILECDGDSTHGYGKYAHTLANGQSAEPMHYKDARQTEYLKSQGFNVIRLWGHEIWNKHRRSMRKLMRFVTSFGADIQAFQVTSKSFTGSFFASFTLLEPKLNHEPSSLSDLFWRP
jgi:very-short-patch-repair endonuclease